MKKINITILLLLLTTLTFAQQAKQLPPIKGVGIVVKKNPGSGASITLPLTNDKGETEVTIPEKGNYTFTLTKSKDVQAKNQGTGVRAVKVGLGKNPPGQVVSYTKINEKGEVEFNDLEKGIYKIVIVKDMDQKVLEKIKERQER